MLGALACMSSLTCSSAQDWCAIHGRGNDAGALHVAQRESMISMSVAGCRCLHGPILCVLCASRHASESRKIAAAWQHQAPHPCQRSSLVRFVTVPIPQVADPVPATALWVSGSLELPAAC